jgi:hypothetical protein
MSALEREIIEKFRRLDKDAQKRVRDLIDQFDSEGFDYDAWFRDVESLREEIRVSHGGKLPQMDVIGILRDIRDGDDE